jgi:hypothetical protein
MRLFRVCYGMLIVYANVAHIGQGGFLMVPVHVHHVVTVAIQLHVKVVHHLPPMDIHLHTLGLVILQQVHVQGITDVVVLVQSTRPSIVFVLQLPVKAVHHQPLLDIQMYTMDLVLLRQIHVQGIMDVVVLVQDTRPFGVFVLQLPVKDVHPLLQLDILRRIMAVR